MKNGEKEDSIEEKGVAVEECPANHDDSECAESAESEVDNLLAVKDPEEEDQENNVKGLCGVLNTYNWSTSIATEHLVGTSHNEEKIYEDLCYVTFSSESFPEVHIHTIFSRRFSLVVVFLAVFFT